MIIQRGGIKENLRVLVAACLHYSGLVKLAHWCTRRSGQRLIILNYHRATGGDLRRQLLYLRRHYRIMHLEDALEEFYTLHKEKKQRRDRRIPLVLTFDDGYRDNYTHGFALAQQLRVPFTIFLIPGYLESREPFWWLAGIHLVCHAQAIDTHLHSARSAAEREAFLVTIRQALAVPSSVPLEEAVQPLTWPQVREMAVSGWASFGAHTMHHSILANLSDPAEVHREVTECRTVLEQHLDHPIRIFAYPVGKPEHIGEVGLKSVQDAGYAWAVTTLYGTNSSQSDPHQLRRVAGDVSRHWLVMAAETSGVWKFFSHLWKNPLVSRMERN